MRFFSLRVSAASTALAVLQFLSYSSQAAARTAESLTDFHLQWNWSVGGIDIGLKGVEVIDLDGDGRDEVVAAASASATSGYWYELHREGDELVQTYSSLPREDGLVGLTVAEEGGALRIVVTGTSSITVYDGRSKRELATFPTISPYNQVAAVGDVDADGILDVVVCAYADLYVYELLTGTARIKPGFGCHDLAIGQIDGDPQLEIAEAALFGGGFILDGSTLDVDWADVRGFAYQVSLGDFDGDGRDEVVSQAPDLYGLRAQDPETGALLWETYTLPPAVLTAANVDGQPGDELLWCEDGGWRIHVTSGLTGVEIHSINTGDYDVRGIAEGDSNGDGLRELAWGTGRGSRLYLARLDANASEIETDDWSGPFHGAAVGDFSGAGNGEVATASHSSDWVYGGGVALVLSLETGRLLRSAPQNPPSLFGQWIDSFAAGQLDGDAALEICLAGGRLLACYDGATFAQQWRLNLQNSVATLRVGEIDGDSPPELLVGTWNSFVYAFEGEDGWLKWRTPDLGDSNPIDRLRLVDVEGGSLAEVIGGSSAQGDGQLTTFSGITGLDLAGPWNISLSSLATLPDVGPPGVVLLGYYDGTVARVDPLTGTQGAAIASFPDYVKALGFADFDRDGTLDIAALLPTRFIVQDGEAGLTLFVSPFLGYPLEVGDSFLIGDLDGDTVPEILVATEFGLAHFEAPLFVVFADGFETGDTSNWWVPRGEISPL